MMPAEFDCEGCGAHVYAFGQDKPPSHQFCATCVWLCEHVPDPDEMWDLYAHLRGAANE
jgi:hypothetical protein